MITTGAQIRAARAMLGMTRRDLADLAGVHPNALKYWEARTIPQQPGRQLQPYAVARIATALEQRGIVTFTDPAPGVRLVS